MNLQRKQQKPYQNKSLSQQSISILFTVVSKTSIYPLLGLLILMQGVSHEIIIKYAINTNWCKQMVHVEVKQIKY